MADGQKIDLPSGETLEINLSENATAGFRWFLKGKLEPQLALEDESFISPEGTKTGAPGTRRWRLKAAGTGTAKLEFQYKRPWEEKVERKVNVSVEVT